MFFLFALLAECKEETQVSMGCLSLLTPITFFDLLSTKIREAAGIYFSEKEKVNLFTV